MIGTTVFALIMFLHDRMETLATYPTQEACVAVAKVVRDQLRETPNQTTVGMACVPTTQITPADVSQQMRALMQIIQEFDTTTGRVDDCAR
jgi:hypothetical protein